MARTMISALAAALHRPNNGETIPEFPACPHCSGEWHGLPTYWCQDSSYIEDES